MYKNADHCPFAGGLQTNHNSASEHSLETHIFSHMFVGTHIE